MSGSSTVGRTTKEIGSDDESSGDHDGDNGGSSGSTVDLRVGGSLTLCKFIEFDSKYISMRDINHDIQMS